MALSEAKLIEKKHLTHNIYELHYKLWEDKSMLAWQFITFILPSIWGRAYSIVKLDGKIAILIIKRWSKEQWGRGWSIYLCDSKIWATFKYVGPAWHFILNEKRTSKCFLWTGTWLVPLYSQIVEALKQWEKSKLHLVFWVRMRKDLFYVENIKKLSNTYKNFSYSLYLSRDATEDTKKWYVTDFLIPENIRTFQEYYICWAPAMIESCQEKLHQLWIKDSHIFFEKY